MDQPISVDAHNIKMLDYRKQGIDRLFGMARDEKALISDRVAALVCVLDVGELKMSKELRASSMSRDFQDAAEQDRVHLRARKAASLATLQAFSADATLENKSRNLARCALRRFTA